MCIAYLLYILFSLSLLACQGENTTFAEQGFGLTLGICAVFLTVAIPVMITFLFFFSLSLSFEIVFQEYHGVSRRADIPDRPRLLGKGPLTSAAGVGTGAASGI